MTRPTSRVCGGIFTPDPALPHRDHTGRRICVCGLLGKPGDAHHTPADRSDADARELAAGEGGAG